MFNHKKDLLSLQGQGHILESSMKSCIQKDNPIYSNVFKIYITYQKKQPLNISYPSAKIQSLRVSSNYIFRF